MNTVNLIGRLTKDIEIKYSQKGKMLAIFSLAVRRDSENADFINCIAFDKTAEILSNYCEKGSQIGVQGSIRVTNNDNKFYTNILINSIFLLGNKENKKNKYNKNNNNNKFESESFEDDNSSDDDDNFPF